MSRNAAKRLLKYKEHLQVCLVDHQSGWKFPCVWTHKASVLPRRLNTHLCHQSHAFQTRVPTVQLQWPLAQTDKLSVWTHTSDWNLFVLSHSHTPQIQFRVALGVTCLCKYCICTVCVLHTYIVKQPVLFMQSRWIPTEDSEAQHVLNDLHQVNFLLWRQIHTRSLHMNAHKRKHTVFF